MITLDRLIDIVCILMIGGMSGMVMMGFVIIKTIIDVIRRKDEQ